MEKSVNMFYNKPDMHIQFGTFIESRSKRNHFLAILAIIFGAGWLICGVSFYIHDELFKKNAYRTTGYVTGYEEVKEHLKKGRTMTAYRIKYVYLDKAGNKHEKTSDSPSNPPEFKVGEEIKIYFNKDNPDKSIYISATRNVLTYIFAGAGAVILICGTVALIVIRKKEQKEQEEAS